MSGIQVGPIKDFAVGIYDGPHATPKESDEGPIFLGIKNVTPEGALDLSEIRHVSEQEYPKWTKRVVPRENDIVFSYEATLHRYALIPDGFRGCLGRRMALVRPDQEKVHPRFLHYYFLTPAWRTVVEANIISGATVDRVPLTRFPDFEVRLPALDVQKRTAETLSAYDDLIENNRRRIQLLEQAARLLYKEWFVHLRVPGHEHVKVMDGVPEGWERKALGDLTTKIGSGATPRGGESAYMTEGITLIRSMNVYDDRFEDDGLAFLDDDQAETLSGVTVEPEDILLNITGASVARCCMVPGRHLPARVNQHVMIIRVDLTKADPYFVLAAINSDERKRQLLSYARAGGTREALTKDMVARFEILVPAALVLRQFSQVVRDFGRQREILADQNVKLRQARDLLLPRLMNGEIAV